MPPRTLAFTDTPLVGLTLATGDGALERSAPGPGSRRPHLNRREDCETVRVVGGQLRSPAIRLDHRGSDPHRR